MLVVVKKIPHQRISDQLFFFKSKECDHAESILTNNCIHLTEECTTIFLTDEEAKKVEAIYLLVKQCSLEQIQHITNCYTKPYKTILSSLNDSFNRRFGWFFKNGNK